jgi:hypothetical protein
MPLYQGNGVRKGRARLALPRCVAYTRHTLVDQQMGSQRDDGIEAQQGRGGAGNGTLVPLALRSIPRCARASSNVTSIVQRRTNQASSGTKIAYQIL